MRQREYIVVEWLFLEQLQNGSLRAKLHCKFYNLDRNRQTDIQTEKRKTSCLGEH